ncbi:Uncharacterised protein [Mycobacteroides abscessus subsp. abscessus]|nr:Uncharacterised protein [Mycobacteroides abscessus subsp. abscessus]
MMAMAIDAARMGPGQRVMAAPMRRQVRMRMARLGSNNPNLLPMVISEGPTVRATATAVSTATAQGTPNVWKYGMRVKLRQYMAPAIVDPVPKMTCAVPWNIS